MLSFPVRARGEHSMHRPPPSPAPMASIGATRDVLGRRGPTFHAIGVEWSWPPRPVTCSAGPRARRGVGWAATVSQRSPDLAVTLPDRRPLHARQAPVFDKEHAEKTCQEEHNKDLIGQQERG